MSVTLGTAAAKATVSVAANAAKNPENFVQNCIAICIGVVGGITILATILFSTVSSFYGESLVCDSTIMAENSANKMVENDIAQYMAELVEQAKKNKAEVIEKTKVTTTYPFYNEKFTSYTDINNRSNQLKEQYRKTANLISCNVSVTTTKKYAYTIEGKTPDGRDFVEEKEFTTVDEVEEYIAYRFKFGYQDLTRTAEKIIYYANFYVNVITCDIQFEEIWKTIPPSYVLAYQSAVTYGTEKIQLPDVNEALRQDFLEAISPLKIDDLSTSKEKRVTFTNETLSPEAIAILLWPDDEMRRGFFLNSQQSYADLLGEGNKVYVDFDFVNICLPIHDYYQTNYRDVAYGNGTIASSGCGPTCIAMLTTYLNGEVTTPVDVCRWCEADYYVPGAGTSWSVFPGAADKYGYGCINMGLDYEAVLEEIANGNPVVVLVGPGTFTSEGHYMVIKGMTSSGELVLNDPNQKNVDKYGTNQFKAETVLGEAKNFWVFFK